MAASSSTATSGGDHRAASSSAEVGRVTGAHADADQVDGDGDLAQPSRRLAPGDAGCAAASRNTDPAERNGGNARSRPPIRARKGYVCGRTAPGPHAGRARRRRSDWRTQRTASPRQPPTRSRARAITLRLPLRTMARIHHAPSDLPDRGRGRGRSVRTSVPVSTCNECGIDERRPRDVRDRHAADHDGRHARLRRQGRALRLRPRGDRAATWQVRRARRPSGRRPMSTDAERARRMRRHRRRGAPPPTRRARRRAKLRAAPRVSRRAMSGASGPSPDAIATDRGGDRAPRSELADRPVRASRVQPPRSVAPRRSCIDRTTTGAPTVDDRRESDPDLRARRSRHRGRRRLPPTRATWTTRVPTETSIAAASSARSIRLREPRRYAPGRVGPADRRRSADRVAARRDRTASGDQPRLPTNATIRVRTRATLDRDRSRDDAAGRPRCCSRDEPAVDPGQQTPSCEHRGRGPSSDDARRSSDGRRDRAEPARPRRSPPISCRRIAGSGSATSAHNGERLDAGQRIVGTVGVHGRQRPVVAGVAGLQHVEGLAAADLADDDAGRGACAVRCGRDRAHSPRLCLLRWPDALRAGRRGAGRAAARPSPRSSRCVPWRRSSGPSALQQVVLPGARRAGDRRCSSPRAPSRRSSQCAVGSTPKLASGTARGTEATDGDTRTVGREGRQHRVQAGAVGESRIDHRRRAIEAQARAARSTRSTTRTIVAASISHATGDDPAGPFDEHAVGAVDHDLGDASGRRAAARADRGRRRRRPARRARRRRSAVASSGASSRSMRASRARSSGRSSRAGSNGASSRRRCNDCRSADSPGSWRSPRPRGTARTPAHAACSSPKQPTRQQARGAAAGRGCRGAGSAARPRRPLAQSTCAPEWSRATGNTEHVFDVGRTERTAVLVDQDRADRVDDRGMADRTAKREIATADDDDPDPRHFRERAGRWRRLSGRDRTHPGEGRRRAQSPNAAPASGRPGGPCVSPAGSNERRGATSTLRWSSASTGAPGPARIQSRSPGAGSCAMPRTAG